MTAVVKLFEIRDEGTAFAVIAIKPDPSNEDERYLYARSGYGQDHSAQSNYVLVAPLPGGSGMLTCDPYKHPGKSRTMKVAHEHIRQAWDNLKSGYVIDVEFILGETEHRKRGERFEIGLS